jgi:Na+-driven multidrug efflux pump
VLRARIQGSIASATRGPRRELAHKFDTRKALAIVARLDQFVGDEPFGEQAGLHGDPTRGFVDRRTADVAFQIDEGPRTMVRDIRFLGLPAGFEFAVTALYLVLVYSITRPFGAAAQAGFGIGMRIVQAGFMPVVALGFSVAPVAGQNFGARQASRVKRTFRDAAWMAVGVMLAFAIVCHTAPAPLVAAFSNDAAVIAVGAEYLRIISWNYVASGLIFVASSMFQAMGNTVPSLVASGVRIALITVVALVVARMPGFRLQWLWYLSVATVFVQLLLSMSLLRYEFGRRLRWEPIAA